MKHEPKKETKKPPRSTLNRTIESQRRQFYRLKAAEDFWRMAFLGGWLGTRFATRAGCSWRNGTSQWIGRKRPHAARNHLPGGTTTGQIPTEPTSLREPPLPLEIFFTLITLLHETLSNSPRLADPRFTGPGGRGSAGAVHGARRTRSDPVGNLTFAPQSDQH